MMQAHEATPQEVVAGIARQLLHQGPRMRTTRPDIWRVVKELGQESELCGYVVGRMYVQAMDCWRQHPPGSPRRDRWALAAAALEILLEMDAA